MKKFKLKAIDTVYRGYKFRSRLEARWAVFFDHAGVEFEYENEGFQLSNGEWYLPDFWVPQWNSFIEIKPNECGIGSQDRGYMRHIHRILEKPIELAYSLWAAGDHSRKIMAIAGSPGYEEIPNSEYSVYTFGFHALSDNEEFDSEFNPIPWRVLTKCRYCEAFALHGTYRSDLDFLYLSECDSGCESPERDRYPVEPYGTKRLEPAFIAARQCRF